MDEIRKSHISYMCNRLFNYGINNFRITNSDGNLEKYNNGEKECENKDSTAIIAHENITTFGDIKKQVLEILGITDGILKINDVEYQDDIVFSSIFPKDGIFNITCDYKI